MLSPAFHLTFMPERRYLAAILEYAALGKEGTLMEMAYETGIPIGKSPNTGKMPAILRYTQGMGLIEVKEGDVKRPVLTAFGRAVYQQDRFMGEPLTQWLLHFNLCRSDIGAQTWNAVFAHGLLGASFTKERFEEYLSTVFGGKNRTGPLVVTYLDDAALGRAAVLRAEGLIKRSKAPLLSSYSSAYSAHLLSLMEAFFPQDSQVTVNDLNEASRWFDISFWSESEVDAALVMMSETGNVSVDRHMRPWIIEKRKLSEQVWPTAWDCLS